uniref:Cadherin domain-containing protein n=1 Tax=Biomphalaria glabrata TaxID=6526 RepID=A0A2C9JQL3_BIOGL
MDKKYTRYITCNITVTFTVEFLGGTPLSLAMTVRIMFPWFCPCPENTFSYDSGDFTATDNDEPGSPNSQVSYLIVSSTPSNLLTHFSPLLTTDLEWTGYLCVLRPDINNQHPVCSQSKYTTSRAEDSVLDVATVHATDKDGTAPNNLILYSIDQSSSEKFIIDSSSGKITLRSQLDREVQHHYIIAVTVTDLGNPPLNGSCQVEVEVTDVNDSPPVFKEKAVTTNIKENTIFSYELVANDSDLNPNLSYSIDWDKSSGLKVNGESVDGSELKNWIQIQDPHHCKVISKKNFDRETFTKMTIELLVKDLNGKVNVPQTDSATLVVDILDVNDNAPFFNGGPTLVASVRENMPINSSVTFVTPTSLEITDPDEKGPNSEYQVTIEDVKNIFDISPTLGEGHQAFVILVKNSIALDYEKIQSVTVKKLDFPFVWNQAFSSTATVTINILNENDNVPVFERSTYSASVAEMSPPHANVISSIKALDKDLGPYGVVSYFLTDDSGKFQIDKNTGYVTTRTGDLDRETKSSYTLIITAKDVNGFSSLTQLTVTVTDINDQSPVFDQQNFAVTIEEGEKKFLPSFFVHATDADDPKSPNSQVEYSLIHATTAPLSNFSLGSASGELLMLSPLNFEALSNNGVIVLHVQAKDKGQPARSSSATITVTVLDINDEKPVFPKSLYSVVISENATKGQSVTQLHATDKDKSSTNNQVSYSLDALSNSKFSINPTTGEITVKDVLDREQVDHYSIIVTAADNGQPVQMSTATVSVTVTDVNDSPPQFYKKSVSVQITENVHQVITVFDARDADLNPDLVYSIEWSSSSGVDGHGQFLSGDTLKGSITINPHTGEVSTVNVLDRESIQRFQLTVQVEDVHGIPGTNQLDSAVLTVVVDDVNDNPPKFNGGPHFTAEVQENMPHGSEVKLDGVSGLYIEDPDGVNNNIFNITVSQNNAFSIGPLIGTGSSTCVIKVADSTLLDYEKVQNFTITVVAYDTKNKSLSSEATIFIKLINENDNIPEFIGAPFQGKISENSKSNTYITTVKAYDADLGLYGQISYFLTDDANKFAINSTTGEVYSLVDDLDRETKANYILTVLAKDYSNFTAQAQLSIDVADIDDKTPVFLNLAYEYNINEGEIKSLTSFYVHATDADDPTTVNSVVNYTLIHTEPNSYSSYFNISVSTGELMILKALDYEELVSLNLTAVTLTVQATDQGLAALSATSHIRVNVLDTNDNSPIFELNPYSFSVPENSIKDVAVGNVAATDKDGTPQNNEIYYVIQSGSQDKFQIDSTSGMIKVGLGATLDREAVTKYFLTVLAVDKGTPSKSSSTQVNITVTDVNDELPVILNATSLVGNVREDAKPNFPVMQVSASDPDVNNNLQYYLFWNESKASDEKDRNVDISRLTNWFEINGTTGEIYVNSTLDRETAQQIILKIVVQDMKAEQRAPQTATASATILLTDVNDNRPVIHLDGQQSMLHLNVSEGTKIGTEVTTLLATDADKDQDVTFSVNDSYYFTISPNGRLKLNKPLDRENQSTVSFIIVAQDNGNPPLSSNITVDITVLDINDNDPEFIGNQTVFQVLENSNLSTSICNITATDKDEGANALVTYTFRDELALFNISSQTGEITVAGSLDREKQSVYTLTVLATDNPELEQRRRASLVIQIELLDVNDNDPHFNIPPGVNYIAKIAEDRKINDIVNIQPQPISATDADVGQNAKVTYSLVTSNVSYFNINPQTGQVFVNESMLGAPGDYSLEVKAIDQGNPPRSNLTNLHITILDVNNNNPYFVNGGPVPSIPECIGLATAVYTFKADDNDTDKTSNALVKYYLLNSTEFPDAGYFLLNPDSGMLSLEKKLSSEQKDLLKIQVQAEDSGDPPRKSEVLQLNINVLDINDHPPEFIENQNTLFSVKEESIGHVEIGTVFVTDRDRYSLLKCDINDPVNPYKDYFEITTSDGKCTIVGIKPFDRENVSHVNLNLVVVDSAHDIIACQTSSGKDNTQSSPKSVTINIVDINDNPPVFITQSLSKGFLSSSEVEKVILNLNDYVTDRDTDANSKHQFYQLGKLEADEDLSKGWLVNSLPDPIKVDINGSIKTNYKFPEDHYGAITLTVLVNDTAGNDTLNLKIFVVGSPQVVEFSFYKSEDELRRLQQDIAKELSDSSIEFVPDDIVSFKDENNDVDGSKSILLMHALQNGKIIDASRLKEILDHQRQKIETLQGFKIIKTETQEEALKMKKETNDTDRIQYILIGIIAAIALTFIITLAMLIHNIGRFKRKLKAATIEVHGLEPMKFPGLDNPLKDSNPIFNRDDATLDSDSDSGHNYDSYSQRSDNSLDKNALGQQEYAEDEQEVVMNMYGGDDAFANLPSPLQYLNDVFVDDERSGPMQRHSDPSQPYDREEEDEVFDFDANQFESTDI